MLHPDLAMLHPYLAMLHPNLAMLHPHLAMLHPHLAMLHPDLAMLHPRLSHAALCNFTGECKCNVRGWACTPHPHQPGLILPSSLNVRQKAAVATLCILWEWQWTGTAYEQLSYLIADGSVQKYTIILWLVNTLVFCFLFTNKIK